MAENTSLQKKASLCRGLVGTKDVNDWENKFLDSVCDRVRDKQSLTEKQEEALDRIYQKHFAGD
jgi:hypothetical protein